uniref:Uncharacterized protein n=1 Tax=Magallana gigas TaxID=29159 RepID=K1Q106_MAGGI
MIALYMNGAGRKGFFQQVFRVQLTTAVETWTSAPSPVAMVGLSSNARATEITPECQECIHSSRRADILLFIKSYLEKNSLAKCLRFSGFSYTTTVVN